MNATVIGHEPVAYAAIPSWRDDDHLAALAAFCETRRATAQGNTGPTADGGALGVLLERARAFDMARFDADDARIFFERHFIPYRLLHDGERGLVTGYYEPVIAGSRVPSRAFSVPIYRRPPELVNLVDDVLRGTVGQELTHAIATADSFVPCATRTEIETGALDRRGLELMYFADPVDVFFLHIQGSGRVRLPDGELVRITYDGKNGHPYTSIGRQLIEIGEIAAVDMSLASLGAWLRADPERGRQTMRANASFVFFRELEGTEAQAPHGAYGIFLTAGRSLAIDSSIHAIGTPIWVAAPTLGHAEPVSATSGFNRLMIAQDVGSAIRGPERGDIFFGSGEAAGLRAGITKHASSFIVLLPRPCP